jgi:hypothetical protein
MPVIRGWSSVLEVTRSDPAQRQRKVILGRDGREGDRRVEAQRAIVRDVVDVKADAARAVRAQLLACLPQRSSTDPAALQGRLEARQRPRCREGAVRTSADSHSHFDERAIHDRLAEKGPGMISYRTVRVDGTEVLYREGGDLTPPGSSCSIQLGTGLRDAPAGSVRNTFLVESDLEAAREWLLRRGVQVSEIRRKTQVNAWDGSFAPGLDPEQGDHAGFADFADPDSNAWVLQERGLRQRQANPGRIPDRAA